jgi:hypothetical protein
MDPDVTESRLEVARQKKATGDAAFKAGDLTEGEHGDHCQALFLRSLFIDYTTLSP